jgi:hypothetical protein
MNNHPGVKKSRSKTLEKSRGRPCGWLIQTRSLKEELEAGARNWNLGKHGGGRLAMEAMEGDSRGMVSAVGRLGREAFGTAVET